MKNKYLLRLQGEVNITVILWNTSHSESTECVDLLHTENVLLTPLRLVHNTTQGLCTLRCVRRNATQRKHGQFRN